MKKKIVIKFIIIIWIKQKEFNKYIQEYLQENLKNYIQQNKIKWLNVVQIILNIKNI